MKTVGDVFVEFKEQLPAVYNVNEINALTLMTISEVCDISKAKIKAFPELELTTHQTSRLKDVMLQLKTGKPIQYILGKTEFFGLPFNVNPSVLIPRPETEELVEWVITSLGGQGQSHGNILDIGTGSGCIAISLKKNLPDFSVAAMDISAEALLTAKGNSALNNVDIQFIESDILNVDTSEISKGPSGLLDIIVSNPPYVTLHDKTLMHSNVTDFEPHKALFVPENDPLLFYKAIANFAMKNLKPGGLLFFEINESFGKQTIDLLAHNGFINIELRKDMSGRDRMIKVSIKPS